MSNLDVVDRRLNNAITITHRTAYLERLSSRIQIATWRGMFFALSACVLLGSSGDINLLTGVLAGAYVAMVLHALLDISWAYKARKATEKELERLEAEERELAQRSRTEQAS